MADFVAEIEATRPTFPPNHGVNSSMYKQVFESQEFFHGLVRLITVDFFLENHSVCRAPSNGRRSLGCTIKEWDELNAPLQINLALLLGSKV